MNARRALRPKEPRNAWLALAGGVVVVVLYLAGSWAAPWSPKRGLGLVMGFLAAGVFVFESAYPFRRSRARPLGTAKAWLQLHVYLGAIAFLAVLAHAGFRWPGGFQGWALLLLSFWVTATGLLGVWLQKWLPLALSEGLRVEALYDRIPGLVQHLLGEADARVAGASDVLARFYATEVRAGLSGLAPSWGYLLDVRAGREQVLEPFRRVVPFVAEAEKEIVDDLATIRLEKMELDVQYTLQGVLRRWLVLHVPPSVVLMGLLVVHVLGWLLY